MKTGVCYYPEHWPEAQWQDDAMRMHQLGLRIVRIGEFAWSRLEPTEGDLRFDWLRRAIDTLHEAGLSVVLGTPTATPPRWMLDKHPDMLAVDSDGRIRDFGSRRHYCFSHEPYIEECKRMVTLLATEFGEHPALVAWQTDNEYGCHSTSISYSPAALAAFRQWCEQRYGTIESLNDAWGNVFWSMEYNAFAQIGLPTGTVTESNPAHQLAYWRFSSDQIKHFNKVQVDILRKHSTGRDILHNFMGNFVEFDHHDVSRDLDIATWDNYPLGFLTRDNTNPSDRERYLRTGHPDGSAFHHDLYRGCCNGRWWVMEQQPGPVNWAPYNPSPVNGMVRLWGWEAFAHGAEVISYFRWRQAPFAQEQTHTGLLLSNGEDDIAAAEVAQLNAELQQLESISADDMKRFAAQGREPGTNESDSSRTPPLTHQVSADIAIVFSYAGIAIQDIQLPGGDSYSPLGFCQRVYSACRQWGANVDIVATDASLERYKLILLCTSTEDDPAFVEKLSAVQKQYQTTIVMFPGTGSRTAEYRMPENLPPGQFQQLISTQVIRSESLPAEQSVSALDNDGLSTSCAQWRENLRSDLTPRQQFDDGWGFHYHAEGTHYINAIPQQSDLLALISSMMKSCEIPCKDLGPYVRTQRIGPYRVACNFGTRAIDLDKALGESLDFHHDTLLIVGSRTLQQAEVAVWVAE